MSDQEYSQLKDLWGYWTDESWDEETADKKEDELYDLVCSLESELQREDWEKLLDKQYVKEHLADKEKEL